MDDVTIVVATFGDSHWADLARTRALPSARRQHVPVVHVHGPSLHEARNMALAQVTTPRVVHLDADDELEPGYVTALNGGTADVRAPAVRYVRGPGAVGPPPRVPTVSGHTHACTGDCLPWGNWLIVGSMADTALLVQAGGWRDFEWSEDWDLWLRVYQAGGTFETIPAAIYRAHVRSQSRNRALRPAARLEAHRAIARANGVPVP